MDIVTFDDRSWAAIEGYDSRLAWARQLAHGTGEADVRLIRVEPGGEIGPHETGRGQVLVPIIGEGWIREGDAEPVTLRVGQAAIVRRGVRHAKGSGSGMVAVMIQVGDLGPGGAL
jgi:quercetin dioxygenase-like cupin family protein